MNKNFFINIILSLIIVILVLTMIVNYIFYQDPIYFLRSRLNIEKIGSENDLDSDGINDSDDILQGARKEILNKPKYKSAYYKGGYPPENEGVCTDVIWRSLKNAGFNLKENIDKDITKNKDDYSRVDIPDPNIDFRRVKNQYVYFKKYIKNLTVEVIPYDIDNLKKWQAGDIVVLKKPDHIAIISDKRRKDGVPYIIHNASTYPKEQDLLLWWSKSERIIGHFRF